MRAYKNCWDQCGRLVTANENSLLDGVYTYCAIKAFNKAIDNVRPRVELKARRVGGATYQVPIEVRQERGSSIALRWIRDFARTKKGRSMQEKLADEIMAAYKGEGATIKKRDEMHKMAEANNALSHFRW